MHDIMHYIAISSVFGKISHDDTRGRAEERQSHKVFECLSGFFRLSKRLFYTGFQSSEAGFQVDGIGFWGLNIAIIAILITCFEPL